MPDEDLPTNKLESHGRALRRRLWPACMSRRNTMRAPWTLSRSRKERRLARATKVHNLWRLVPKSKDPENTEVMIGTRSGFYLGPTRTRKTRQGPLERTPMTTPARCGPVLLHRLPHRIRPRMGGPRRPGPTQSRRTYGPSSASCSPTRSSRRASTTRRLISFAIGTSLLISAGSTSSFATSLVKPVKPQEVYEAIPRANHIRREI